MPPPGQGQGPPPGSRPMGPPPGSMQPTQGIRPNQPQQIIHQQPRPQQQPLPVVRKAAPPPQEEDEIDDDYDDDDFADDFEEEEPEPPKKGPAAAAAATSKPPTTTMPNAAAVQQMIARENQALNARPSLASGPAVGGVLSASSASAVPVRKYVPIPSKQQRAVQASSKESSRKAARARKILQQVSLSVERFDNLFHMDPMTKFDLATREKQKGRIRDIGSQYNDDWLSQECQTDDSERYSLGVQAPDDLSSKVLTRAAATSTGVSTSTGTDTETELPVLSSISTARLSSFLSSASAVIEVLIAESRSSLTGGVGGGSIFSQEPGSLGAISAAKLSLTCPEIFGPRTIKDMCFMRARNQSLLVAYSKVIGVDDGSAFDGTAHKGLILLWDVLSPAQPSKVLLLDGSPTVVGSDHERAHIVFAGTEEGSIAVWDLREDAHIHRTIHQTTTTKGNATSGHTHILRQASFSTDCLHTENHESAVRRIVSLTEYDLKRAGGGGGSGSDENDSAPSFDLSSLGVSGVSANFQFASLDDFGGLYSWTGIELQHVDPAGSESDLGLLPGSKVKIVRTASLLASSIGQQQAYDVAVKPDETNEYIVGLGRGRLKRGRRYGSKPQPNEYTPLLKTPIGDDATSIAFHPHHPEYFLVGYKSGSICLYHLDCSLALHTWWHVFGSSSSDAGYAGLAAGVVKLEWSTFRESTFIAIDTKGAMQLFDLIKSPQKPIASALLSPTAAPSSSLPPPPPCITLSHATSKLAGLNTHMLAFPTATATIEVHQLRPAFAQINQNEKDKFKQLLAHLHAAP